MLSALKNAKFKSDYQKRQFHLNSLKLYNLNKKYREYIKNKKLIIGDNLIVTGRYTLEKNRAYFIFKDIPKFNVDRAKQLIYRGIILPIVDIQKNIFIYKIIKNKPESFNVIIRKILVIGQIMNEGYSEEDFKNYLIIDGNFYLAYKEYRPRSYLNSIKFSEESNAIFNYQNLDNLQYHRFILNEHFIQKLKLIISFFNRQVPNTVLINLDLHRKFFEIGLDYFISIKDLYEIYLPRNIETFNLLLEKLEKLIDFTIKIFYDRLNVLFQLYINMTIIAINIFNGFVKPITNGPKLNRSIKIFDQILILN